MRREVGAGMTASLGFLPAPVRSTFINLGRTVVETCAFHAA